MTMVEEIVAEMKFGRNAMFLVGLISLLLRDPQGMQATLLEAMKEYRNSESGLGPIAKHAANIKKTGK